MRSHSQVLDESSSILKEAISSQEDSRSELHTNASISKVYHCNQKEQSCVASFLNNKYQSTSSSDLRSELDKTLNLFSMQYLNSMLVLLIKRTPE